MMKKLHIYFAFFLLALGCKEKYTPDVNSNNRNLLVVEGFINTGADSTFIKLSRTVIVANKQTLNPEIGATVSIESASNEIFPLKEKEKGNYVTAPLNLNNTKKYRLNIKTNNGATYVSDFVESKVSAPIDSVNWKVNTNSVELFVSTHDTNNQTRYYRWDYTETWIFYSKYNSAFIFNNTKNQVVARNYPDEEIYKCYGTQQSSTIYLGSSAKLNQDVIHEALLATIPSNSEKIQEKYSVLVRQYPLTKEAYDFWQNLKKNTETLGSIFDAQPSQLVGNIHRVNDTAEPVIGYISACKIQERRIFIDRDRLPKSTLWQAKYPYDCGSVPDTVLVKDVVTRFKGNEKIFLPIDALLNSGGLIYAYTAASRTCVDCTIRGANKKPAFWQ